VTQVAIRATIFIRVIFMGLLIGLSSPLSADEPEWVAAEVRKIDLENSRVTLRHGEIESVNMSAMTMVFAVRDVSMLEAIKVGDAILFTVVRDQGRLVVTQIKPAPQEN
jgi:Cu/Ag efflux protein CusF